MVDHRTARPIVLIGMMGSGKSTIGEQLAHRLGRRFVDIDAELERQTRRSVADLFGLLGEFKFRSAEADLLADLLHDDAPLVIATGGGAIVRRSNRDFLRMAGATAIWLRATPEVLAARVGSGEGRPLLDGVDDDGGVIAELARIAAEREMSYADAATLVVDVDDLAPEEVVDEILHQLESAVLT